jgi:hypothetical protein
MTSTAPALRRCFILLLLALSLASCGSLGIGGLFESEEERQQRMAQSFEEGMREFEQKNYVAAVKFFREVPPESKLYNRALAMVRRVPYQRGVDAYEAQRYADAERQFKAVPAAAGEYEQAQTYLYEIEMLRLEQRYRSADSAEKRELLSELVSRARNTGDDNRVQELMSRGQDAMLAGSTAEQQAWLAWFQEHMNTETSTTVRRDLLNSLMQNYSKMANEPATRSRALDLMASLKLSLQDR